MAIREYKCPSCGLMMEKIIPTNDTPPPYSTCSRCGAESEYRPIPSSIGIATSNFSHQKMDVAIGRDAERRWADINERQQIRDSVRQKSGQVGLSMVGRNEFVPLSSDQMETRTDVMTSLTKSTPTPGADTSVDKKVLGVD